MLFSQPLDPSLTCQSCTYWLQKKGSYGVCKTFPERKPYDGSRKGSACLGWRISNNNNSLQTFPKKGQEKKEHYPSLRKVYNDLHKPKLKATHITNIDGDFVSFTSDIHTKNGYYRHRYNYTLIDVALTLFLQGKTYNEVVKHMKDNYMKPMSRRTFREWIIKFLGQAWDERYCNEVFVMCTIDRVSMVKNGKAWNGKQEYKCQKCKKRTTV